MNFLKRIFGGGTPSPSAPKPAAPSSVSPPDTKNAGAALTQAHMDVGDKMIREIGADRALFQASGEGLLPMVIHIIRRGADVNFRSDQGVTPLMIAAQNGKTNVVRELIEQGAIIQACAHNGESAYDAAVACKHDEIAQILLKAGAHAVQPATMTPILDDASAGWVVRHRDGSRFTYLDARQGNMVSNPEWATTFKAGPAKEIAERVRAMDSTSEAVSLKRAIEDYKMGR